MSSDEFKITCLYSFFFFCNSEDKSEDKFFLYAKQIIDADSVFTQN